MRDWDGSERVALAADRHEFRQELAEEPAYKPALVEALDTSRSTVDRAIRELEDAGLGDVTCEQGRREAAVERCERAADLAAAAGD